MISFFDIIAIFCVVFGYIVVLLVQSVPSIIMTRVNSFDLVYLL